MTTFREPTEEKNAEAVKRGRKGGKKGGNARAKVLGAAKRKAIAKKGAATRWSSTRAR
jgi:hypothetical protein